jgi:hypothetical protein
MPGGRLVAALARLGGAGPVPSTPVIDPSAVSGGTRVALSWDQPGALQAFGEEAFQPAASLRMDSSGSGCASNFNGQSPFARMCAIVD